jgi:proteasome lid subunit RPN8/RPN11
VTNPDGARRLEGVVRARNLNTERARDRYELDPRAFLEADDRARAGGREVIAVYHTHPDHPAEPSETDLARAWEGWSYIIVSVREGTVAAVRSWRLVGGAFEEESISAPAASRPGGEET